jgi:cytochrome P450
MSDGATALRFDPLMGGTDDNPYPLYEWLREEHPVHYDPSLHFYALSRYDDVQTVSRDWRCFSSADGIDIDGTGDYFGPNFVNCDPPRHRVVRGLVQHRFSPIAVRQALEPIVRAEVDRLVDSFAERSEVDLGHELCWPLPFAVSCRMLGFPPEDEDFLRGASERFEQRHPGDITPPAAAENAAAELRDYVSALAASRRRHPRDDLVSLLATAEHDGRPLPHAEVVGNAFALFNAGTQTTACLLSTAIVELLDRPDLCAWLVTRPDRVPPAVEEFLRFHSPIQHFRRTSTDDVVLHGTEIPAGSTVLLLYGAANRDPRAWTDPERLDLEREPHRHLAFGDGIHHCIGAPIARLEACIALAAILPLLRTARPAASPVRLASHQLRGYVSVPAELA